MKTLKRTTSKDPDFIRLVNELDAYLRKLDGEEHAFYNQYNAIENLGNVAVLYKNEMAVACGAFKMFDDKSVEIKRMYTSQMARNEGCASLVLDELEKWAVELGFSICVLETGHKQKEANNLYLKCGYAVTLNYGQYVGIENSICYKKELNDLD